MSITNRAVTAGIQSATSTAKGQVTDHYGKKINKSHGVSKSMKNALHIGMQGAAAAGAVVLTETMLKAYEDIQKGDISPTRHRKSIMGHIGDNIMPVAVGLSAGMALPPMFQLVTRS